MILIVLASIGLALVLLARWIVLRDAPDLSPGSRRAVRLLPFYELILLISGHQRAHRGSLIGVIGLALAAPLAAQMLSATHARPSAAGAWRSVAGKKDSPAQKAVGDEEQARLLKLQDEKVRELTAYMTEWYALLESGRETLCAPEEIEDFNRSVAAYRDLRAVQDIEMQLLTKMEPDSMVPSIVLPRR